MKTIVLRDTPRRIRPGRLRPQFDLLETRLALSAAGLDFSASIAPTNAPSVNHAAPTLANLSVTTLNPVLGKTLAGPHSSLTITFDRPIDPVSLSNDFIINRIAADGSATPIDSLGNGVVETPGADGSSIVVATAHPLSPGTYQLVLSGNAGVYGLDSSLVSSNDQNLGQFQVVTPGIGIGDATELGVASGSPVSVSDQLDLATTPGDVRLYRVELPATRSLWRLGVEVDTTRVGSPLTTALSLLDSLGNPITTSQNGRPDFPKDPYLFAGLKPGTYYIGVSGAGNVPGGAHGYSLTDSTPGSSNPGIQPGAFVLKVAADPAETPTGVKTFFLNYADPTDPTPTGLTLQFSGPIDESVLRSNSGTAISIVDASGTSWTTHAIGYDEAQASITFVFDRTLPQGTYSVKLAGQGGLVDLAGQKPVSQGYPDGTLAMFLVGPATPKSDPHDLGPILLQDDISGLSQNLKLAPGQAVTYRLVITIPGLYDFQTTSTGDSPSMVVTAGGNAVTLVDGAPGVLTHHFVSLLPGVVTFKATGGSQGSELGLLIKLPKSLLDQLLDNGVGQTAALDLRLISPTSLTAGLAPSLPGGDGPSLAAVGLVTPPDAFSTSSPTAVPASNPTALTPSDSSTGLYITTAGLVGHPSSQNESIAVVGPVTPDGLSPLASNSPGIPLGLSFGYGQRSRTPKPHTTGEIEAVALKDGETIDPAVVLTSGDLPPLPEAVGPVVAVVSDRVPAPSASEAVSDDLALSEIHPGAAPTGPNGEEQVETADFSGSLGIGVIAVAFVTCQHQIGRWIERRHSRIIAKRRVSTSSQPQSGSV